MTDVAGIAVAIEKDELCARRICVGRIKPTVEIQAVAGFEKDVFERTTELRASGLQWAHRMIDAAVFKPAEQHWKYDAILRVNWRVPRLRSAAFMPLHLPR